MDSRDQVLIFDVAKRMGLRLVGMQTWIGKKEIGLLIGDLFVSASSPL